MRKCHRKKLHKNAGTKTHNFERNVKRMQEKKVYTIKKQTFYVHFIAKLCV